MGEVTQSIDVNANLQTVYNQWTQFEEFPRFMEGVNGVEQLDEARLRWTVEIAGVERQFDAEITEQRPDERVAWKSTSGVDQAGVVTFHRLGDNDTRVTLQMKFDPDGFAEQAADKLGFVTTRTKGDLERFKEFIEGRPSETGAWRGEIEHDRSSGAGREVRPNKEPSGNGGARPEIGDQSNLADESNPMGHENNQRHGSDTDDGAPVGDQPTQAREESGDRPNPSDDRSIEGHTDNQSHRMDQRPADQDMDDDDVPTAAEDLDNTDLSDASDWADDEDMREAEERVDDRSGDDNELLPHQEEERFRRYGG